MKRRMGEDRFLGVRLDAEDLERLDRMVQERGFSNRSEAIRRILRESVDAGIPARAPGERVPRGRSVEVPPVLFRELERSVENGYSSAVESALEKAIERGLEELARQRSQRVELERATAQKLAQEDADQRRASREGERHGGK